MKEKNQPMEMNLQFFAEPETEGTSTGRTAQEQGEESYESSSNDEQEQQPSVEEQLQQALIENAKLKKEKDRASTEAADYKKKYNATLTDAQKAAQEKATKEAEREEKYNQLLKENTVNKLEKKFLALGYPEEKANQAAIAQYDNDTDTLFKIQGEMQQAAVKKAEAEWLKNRPAVNTGAGDEGGDPFLQGFDS